MASPGPPATPGNVFPPTPAMFSEGLPPWVTQTPEASPMIWERTPSTTKGLDGAAGGLTMDILRRVCEPYFEHMLLALHSVLLAQHAAAQSAQSASPYSTQCGVEEAAEPAFGSCFQTTQIDRLSEEQVEADDMEPCAFSSVLVDNSSWNNTPQTVSSTPAAQQTDSAKQVSTNGKPKDPEKSPGSTIIVCRHWKSKGWCRMESACKFAHPEHKCGVGVAGPKGASGAQGDGHNSNSSDDGATAGDAAKKSRKRRSKAKAPKAPPGQLDGPGDAIGVHSAPPGMLRPPC